MVDGVPRTVYGQSAVAVTPGRVEAVRLLPEGASACPEAVAAVDEADWVVLGPGSWFTSVLPHVLVPELSAALHRTAARRCVTLNLRPDDPAAMTNLEHLRALAEHAPDLRVDVVVADPGAVVHLDELAEQAAAMGAELVLRQVGVGDGTARHDALRLAAAFRDAFEGHWGDLGGPDGDGRMTPMALTAQVKDELARLPVDKTSWRKAEVSATLRFAGGLHIISGRIVIEAELDTGIAARRLRQFVSEVYGHTSDVVVVSGGACARARGTWSGWCATASRWPGRPACSTRADARSVACPRRWSAPGSGRPRPRGAAPSWRTAR